MLNVSQYIALAREPERLADLMSRSPERFGRSGRRAPVVVWNVCRHCNMSCPHCYAGASVHPSPHALDTDEAVALVDDLAEANVRVLILSGGEPLLRGDIVAICRRASERGLVPLLSSNGVLLDVHMASALADAGVEYVGVSIDGMPAFNDPYRGLARAFERALAGLDHAGRRGMRTGLRVTLTRHNCDQLESLMEVACSRGIDRFYVSHLLYSGRGAAMAEADLGPAQCRRTLLWLFERAEAWLDRPGTPEIVTGGNDSGGVLLLWWLQQRYPEEATAAVGELLALRGGNSAGERLLNIDERGRVHPDPFWRQMTLGDTCRQSFSEILDHPFRRFLAEREDWLQGRCGACAFRGLCRGSHRERALAHHRDLRAPDPACVMRDEEIGFFAESAEKVA